jgi:hypothetical protein
MYIVSLSVMSFIRLKELYKYIIAGEEATVGIWLVEVFPAVLGGAQAPKKEKIKILHQNLSNYIWQTSNCF